MYKFCVLDGLVVPETEEKMCESAVCRKKSIRGAHIVIKRDVYVNSSCQGYQV